jgi:alcohol dehydrogenase class IV
MSTFEFATANRIIFGAGKLLGLGDQLKGRVKRLLLVCGNSSDAIPRVREILSAQDIPFDEFHVHGEPTVDTASEGVLVALDHGADMVVGLGGGSVLDAGKAISALATNRGDIFDYLEVVGKGGALMNAPLPYIAIPTTAGTGTEVTRNAVLESPSHGVKVSLRSPMMLPSIALVDPELTYSLPSEITASSGLDALTQLIEPFVSVKANPMTDAICREGIRHAAQSLRQAYHNGADASAREGMALASLFGGMALANAALGTVHGFAGPLGGMLHAPHGAICARLLPLVMEANIKALESRHAGHLAIEKYIEIAQIVTRDKNASAQDGVKWVSDLVSELNIPSLSAHGMNESQISEAVEKTLNASSFKGNPIALNEGELREILLKAM